MAAHLDPVRLCRRAVPEPFMSFDHRAPRLPAVSGECGRASRPRLVATWQRDGSDRLVCSWSVDTDDPPLPA